MSHVYIYLSIYIIIDILLYISGTNKPYTAIHIIHRIHQDCFMGMIVIPYHVYNDKYVLQTLIVYGIYGFIRGKFSYRAAG